MYLDWIAVGFTLGQMYLLGHRKALGWPVGIVACALWITWASDLGLWSIVVINVLLAALAARGWYRWSSRDSEVAEAVGPVKGPILPIALGSVRPPEASPGEPEAGPARRET